MPPLIKMKDVGVLLVSIRIANSSKISLTKMVFWTWVLMVLNLPGVEAHFLFVLIVHFVTPLGLICSTLVGLIIFLKYCLITCLF